jgi:hypothetical protein
MVACGAIVPADMVHVEASEDGERLQLTVEE